MANRKPFCDGLKRRDLLKIGVASTLGASMSLPDLLRNQASAGESASKTDVSLIILFLQGGLSTIDTLDLKMKAPAEFRGEFHPIDTNVPGIEICEHLPAVAQQADKFSLIRSFTHNNSGHGPADHYMLTGYHPTAGFNASLRPNNQRPSHGSIIAKKTRPPRIGAAVRVSSQDASIVWCRPSGVDGRSVCCRSRSERPELLGSRSDAAAGGECFAFGSPAGADRQDRPLQEIG